MKKRFFQLSMVICLVVATAYFIFQNSKSTPIIDELVRENIEALSLDEYGFPVTCYLSIEKTTDIFGLCIIAKECLPICGREVYAIHISSPQTCSYGTNH